MNFVTEVLKGASIGALEGLRALLILCLVTYQFLGLLNDDKFIYLLLRQDRRKWTKYEFKYVQIVSLIVTKNIFFFLFSDSKWMSLIHDRCTTISGHFFAICLPIFHKTQVQTVILRCLMGLDLDWFKFYGLRCSLRPHASSANYQKIATDKCPFYDHIHSTMSQI